jgi:hypothetical protein
LGNGYVDFLIHNALGPGETGMSSLGRRIFPCESFF